MRLKGLHKIEEELTYKTHLTNKRQLNFHPHEYTEHLAPLYVCVYGICFCSIHLLELKEKLKGLTKRDGHSLKILGEHVTSFGCA